ncbi:MAG: phosphorylase, partial [Gemmatimonadaceae bacterium]|nr:phosphorylase [Gloeobacterales cyanobacterium ES-bin-141]
MPIDAILVPRGAEYQAVIAGLKWPTPTSTFAVPAGPVALAAHLALLPKAWQRVLIVGLCGSLAPEYAIGDVVVYEECVQESAVLQCDPELTQALGRAFPTPPVVRALTTGQVLCSASEKRRLGEQHRAAVVDMEGFAALEVLG